MRISEVWHAECLNPKCPFKAVAPSQAELISKVASHFDDFDVWEHEVAVYQTLKGGYS